jgi:uncharacterized protein
MRTEPSTDGEGDLRDRLRRGLPAAMKARDPVAVAALRSALSAIENAEAVDAGQAPPPTVIEGATAGAIVGLRAAEVDRRALTQAQVEAIVRAEVADRTAAAGHYDRLGQPTRAEKLRAEATILHTYLSEPANEG